MSGKVVATPSTEAPATVEKLFDDYAKQVSPTKGGERWEVLRLKALAAKFPLFAGPVSELDAPALSQWRDLRLTQVSAHTVNRELGLVSAVFNQAIKEWHTPGIARNPVHDIKRPKVPDPRSQRVAIAERAAIVLALGWDGATKPTTSGQFVALAFCLALETAMRKSEILRLTWRHIHLDEQWVHLPKTKNGHARDVPLSTMAAALVRMLSPGDADAPAIPVMSGNLDKLFREAKALAGVPQVRFHDSRREATTVMAGKLGNVLELAAVTGHRSLDLLRRTYYSPKATDLAKKLG